MVAEQGAKQIGAATRTGLDGSAARITEGSIEHYAAHAALGCATGSVSGNCASGATGGVLGEMSALAYKKEYAGSMTQAELRERAGNRAAMIGAVSGAVVGEGGDAVHAGSNAARNAAENNALYFRSKKVKYTDWIRTDDVEDFDFNLGIQGTVTHIAGNYGTDGAGLSIDLNPSVGAGIYFSLSPRGHKAVGSNTLGFKNLLLSGGPLYTNKGRAGLGIAIGVALPFYPVPVNATVNIPLDKLNNKNQLKNDRKK